MTSQFTTVPAVTCPLRNYALVEAGKVCSSCIYLEEYREYYAPREGGEVYCKFSYLISDHVKAYNDFRRGAQDEAMRQLHRDEAAKLRKAAGL